MANGFTSEDPEVKKRIAEMQTETVAKSSFAPAAPPAAPANITEAESLARFGTPLPNRDPASLRGTRPNELYIGPTNFAALQKQYTPYQIEQATTRNEAGDIFWKQGVDISRIPPSSTGGTAFAAPSVVPTKTATDVSAAATTTIDAVARTTAGTADLAKAQTDAANTYLKGIDATIDSLRAKEQDIVRLQKEQAERERAGVTDRYEQLFDTDIRQRALDADRKLFQVQQNIGALGDIRLKIAEASTALATGLIYERDQPVRMALLTGRSAKLKEQGLASLGALQASAQIIQGNIDLARAYADDTQQAISADIRDRVNALDTLLNLYNKDLVDLTDRERELIDERRNALENESKTLEKRKNDMFDLAVDHPIAFSKGGVTFNDSLDIALKKMTPFLAELEQQEIDLKIAAKKRAGGGGAGASPTELGLDLTKDQKKWFDKFLEDMDLGTTITTREDAETYLFNNQGRIKLNIGEEGVAAIQNIIDQTFPKEEQTPEEKAAAIAEAEGREFNFELPSAAQAGTNLREFFTKTIPERSRLATEQAQAGAQKLQQGVRDFFSGLLGK